jgi:hypothetical protein
VVVKPGEKPPTEECQVSWGKNLQAKKKGMHEKKRKLLGAAESWFQANLEEQAFFCEPSVGIWAC